MRSRLLRWSVVSLLTLGVVAAIVYALTPSPVPVDIAPAERGDVVVAVTEEGRTRIREKYVVSSPLTGRLRRITLDPGDPVIADTTVLAVVEPTPPELLDARVRLEAEARVRAAEAAVQRASALGDALQIVADQAENDRGRVTEAYERAAATESELDRASALARSAAEELRAARFAEEIARFELELARSALLFATGESTDEANTGFEIRAPVTGAVLRVLQESVAVVAPGAPLLEIGDPADIELVIDVLSTDAVKIRPGQRVVVEHWGGEAPLEAAVRLVEPSAFTEISALGIEEQRVNIIADLTSPPGARDGLGDGFRIEARIVVREERDVLRIPASSLFREGEGWAVFAVSGGRAALRRVEVGEKNSAHAEITSGLSAGDRVITHPSDKLHDGVRISTREQ